MSRIIMQHPEGSRRQKQSVEVMDMILQYQSQVLTCENQQAVKLMTQKINGLRKLVEGEGDRK